MTGGINIYVVEPFLTNVLKGGFCIGCGACASIPGSPLRMDLNEFGIYQPVIGLPYADTLYGFDIGEICPFHQDTYDEDQIGQQLFSHSRKYDPRVGFYEEILAGYAAQGDFRSQGASGGITTWLLTRLLQEGLVDGALHVAPIPGVTSGPLFQYTISRNAGEVAQAAGSHYYSVQFSQVISEVRNNPGRYAFIGVPCFVKAIRLLARNDPLVRSSIKYCLATFCGHLKTAAYAEALAWQMGVSPKQLRHFDFRLKIQGRPASRYAMRAFGICAGRERVVEVPASDLFGSDWGEGLFKPKGCDFCDDIVGETADVSFGDAWLPPYTKDSRGTNLIIVRNRKLHDVIRGGIANGELVVDVIGPDKVCESQAGNYRHRREGLGYRLWKFDRCGMWHPRKRQPACRESLPFHRCEIYDLRSSIAEESHGAFLRAKLMGDLALFIREMQPLLKKYHRANGTYGRYLARSAIRRFKQILRISQLR